MRRQTTTELLCRLFHSLIRTVSVHLYCNVSSGLMRRNSTGTLTRDQLTNSICLKYEQCRPLNKSNKPTVWSVRLYNSRLWFNIHKYSNVNSRPFCLTFHFQTTEPHLTL